MDLNIGQYLIFKILFGKELEKMIVEESKELTDNERTSDIGR